MVQPAAIAGATFAMIWCSGKFHGVIRPATPNGSRTTSEWPISSWNEAVSASVAKLRVTLTGVFACTAVDIVIGMPTSWLIVVATSATRASSASASLCSHAARSAGVVSAHPPSNAARAARTARSTSSAVPRATRPITSSVDAERTAISSVSEGRCHAPSM